MSNKKDPEDPTFEPSQPIPYTISAINTLIVEVNTLRKQIIVLVNKIDRQSNELDETKYKNNNLKKELDKLEVCHIMS